MAIAIVVAATVITLVLALGTLALRRPKAVDPVARAYTAFCTRLARAGHVRRPAEGPLDFASRLAAMRPDLADAVKKITGLYVNLRYGPAPQNGEITELTQTVDQFLKLRLEV